MTTSLPPLNWKRRIFFALLALLTLSAPSLTHSQENEALRKKFAVGLGYTGGLARYGFNPAWAAQAHYLIGSADSDDGNVNAAVIGARGYRLFRTDKKLQYYSGIELDSLRADSNNFKSTGFSFGGFAGAEFYVFPWLSVTLDLGPYYLSMKAGGSSSGVDFILNSYINFYIL